MKKLFVTMLTILSSGAVLALPVGNPSDASLLCDGLIWEGHCGDPCDPCLRWFDAFSVRVGFYGDYIFNRHLSVDSGPEDHDIEESRLFTNAGYFIANFWDRFDVFATIGMTNLFIDTNVSAFNGAPLGSRAEVETNSGFSWSIGARATIWECGCTTFGAEGAYFRMTPDVIRVTAAALTSNYPNDVHLRYQEWQVGIGISHRINIFVPYVAVKWSHARGDFGEVVFDVPPFTLFDIKSKKHWGYAVGVSLIDCEKASLTVEGRFADEKALHVNGQLRF